MKIKTTKIFIICLIFSLISTAPPPKAKPKPPKVRVEESTPAFLPKNDILPLFKRLQSAEQHRQNSTLVFKFYDTYIAEEHELIIVPKNLPNGNYYEYWSFLISSDGINLDSVTTFCEILNADGEKSKDSNCISSFALLNTNSQIRFTYNYTLYNTNILKIKMKYIKTTDDQILYKTEWINIPFINDFSFCNYTYILSEGVVSLGLENNILKK